MHHAHQCWSKHTQLVVMSAGVSTDRRRRNLPREADLGDVDGHQLTKLLRCVVVRVFGVARCDANHRISGRNRLVDGQTYLICKQPSRAQRKCRSIFRSYANLQMLMSCRQVVDVTLFNGILFIPLASKLLKRDWLNHLSTHLTKYSVNDLLWDKRGVVHSKKSSYIPPKNQKNQKKIQKS